jgi:hypothetical protein
MMTKEVTDTFGRTVHVLDTTDLSRAKNSLIRWMFAVAIPAVVLSTVFVTRLQGRIERTEDGVARSDAHIIWSAEGVRQLDSLRIEQRHQTEAIQALSATVERLTTLLERRGYLR